MPTTFEAAIRVTEFYAAFARVKPLVVDFRANGSQQARNIDGSLAVNVGTLPAGPVLLVDDMVDSRWTLTVAAWLLTANGGRLVYPLALALTANAE